MSSTNSNSLRPNFSSAPLLWLAICVSIGILIASNTTFNWVISFLLSFLSAIISLLFDRQRIGVIFVFFAFLFAGAFLLQVTGANRAQNSLKNFYDTKRLVSGEPIEIEGVLEGKPELAVGGMYFILQTERAINKGGQTDISGRVRIFAPIRNEKLQREYRALDLTHGARLRITCNLTREERFSNPGGVSFRKILDQKNIDAVATLKSPLLIERLGNESRGNPLAPIFDYRQNLIESFRDNFSVSTSGILIASLLGNRQFLTKDTAEIFRDGGTFHVLVISGLHITFIGGLILFFVRRFAGGRFWQFGITTAALWLYSLAVGAEVPVIRAALMFTILLFSFVIYRKQNLLNALGGCALLILIWRPEDLFNQSFHLTFASLIGIIALAFPLLEKLRAIGSWQPSTENPFPPNVSKQLRKFCENIYWSERKWKRTLSENLWDCRLFKSQYAAKLENFGLQKPIRWAFEGVLVTTVVQILLLPFLVFYFHRIAFSSVVLNLWVGVFIVLQNIAAILAVFCSQISNALAFPVIKVTELFNWLLLALPKAFIAGDIASARIPIYSGSFRAIYLLYFLPVILILGFVKSWNPFARNLPKKQSSLYSQNRLLRISLIVYFVCFCALVFHPFSAPARDGRLRVEFLDVGQGDSIFITFPDGKTMLVDGGGKHNFQQSVVAKSDGEIEPFEPDIRGIGETVVSEFLWEKGYSKVDFLVATHADADHIQGLTDVQKNFDVKAIFVGRQATENEGFAELEHLAIRKNVGLTALSRGDIFEIGGVKLEVLNPNLRNDAGGSSNNDSVVLRLTYGAKKFLLTGDIEMPSEKELTKSSFSLKADVVKIAHHGSKTSSIQSFIDETGADYAVIPVGRKSRFGHPHDEVIKRWMDSGAKVLTTGEKGTVSISTDGKDLEVQTFLK